MPLDSKAKEALTFLGTHLIYGLAAGAAFGIGALVIDLGQLRTLASNSSHPVLVLFFFGLFVTFGSVGMGVGIMSLGKDDESDRDLD